MDISLVAKMKKYNEFLSCYVKGDENKLYNGKSLLFYSLSNNDIESRYLISKCLLDEGIEVNGVNEEGENVLHILLSRTKHDLEQTLDLCHTLIEKGVDINCIDNKGRVPLQYIVNMKYTDEELEPLYNLFFSQGNLMVNCKNAWGKTPLEIAEQIPYRKSLMERLKNMSKEVTFISNAGGCIVSKNILSHKGKLKWCVREQSMNNVDNGWRFLSDIDTDEYLSIADNMCV